MRITAANEIDKDDLGDDLPDGEWVDRWISQQNEVNRQSTAAINGQLTINENTTSRTGDYVMKHGVTYASVKNPLSVPIQGIYATRAIQLETNADGSFTRKVFPCPNPIVQWQPSAKQDGSVDITLQFPAPVGDITLSSCANPNIAANGETFLQWNTAVVGGSAMSFSSGAPTRITCSVAGKIEAWGQISWAAGTASTRRDCKMFLSNVQRASSIEPGTGGVVFQNISVPLTVAAGDYVELKANHDSATTPLSCAFADAYLAARYIGPPAGFTAKVTLLFVGG